MIFVVAGVPLIPFAAPVTGAHALASTSQLSAALNEIVTLERTFSDLADEQGVRAAMLAFIADDGILFAPRPVPGKPLLARSPTSQDRLSWVPSFAGAAASGDIGFTSGPYILKHGTGTQTGQYVTIWRRQPNGDWRFVLDRGTAGPIDADLATTKLTTLSAVAAAISNAGNSGAKSELLAQEAALALACQESAAVGLAARLAEDARVLREGAPPSVNPAEHAKLLEGGEKMLRYNVLASEVSAAGDLGYTYGDVAWGDEANPGSGGFVRLWQKRGTRWQIVLDSLAVVPPAPRQKQAGIADRPNF